MTNPAASARPQPGSVLTKATLDAARRLGLRNRELGLIIGSSEASVSRLRAGRVIDPGTKEGELALMFLRMFRSLDALMGGNEAQARAWLTSMNEHIGGVPSERIQQVEGLVDVVQYLDAMRGRL